MDRLTIPRASPRCSAGPSGSTSMPRVTRVRAGPSASNVTTPSFRAPLVDTHAMRRSGTCSMILACHVFAWPPTDAVHSRVASSSWTTRSTLSMNCGKLSNCVHWPYAVETGTSTSMESWILLMRGAPFG